MCELIGIIPMFESVYHKSEMLANQISNKLAIKGVSCMVPTSYGNHGRPGKSRKKVPCMENSWKEKKK